MTLDIQRLTDLEECAQYILSDDREKNDFSLYPTKSHVYYLAVRAIEGEEEADKVLREAEEQNMTGEEE